MEQLDPTKFDSKYEVDYIRDPIYKYIKITKPTDEDKEEVTEKNFLDSRWVQRLRRIYQLQGAFGVYPGAEHSRFSHALGVMHLAGEFAKTMYQKFEKQEREFDKKIEHAYEVHGRDTTLKKEYRQRCALFTPPSKVASAKHAFVDAFVEI